MAKLIGTEAKEDVKKLLYDQISDSFRDSKDRVYISDLIHIFSAVENL